MAEKKIEVVKFENIATNMTWEAEVGSEAYKNMVKNDDFARIVAPKPTSDTQPDANAAKSSK